MCSQPAVPRAGNASPSATNRSASDPVSRAETGFPKRRRIRKRANFRAVYDGGVRVGAKLVTVFALTTDGGLPARVGLTVTRKIGNAVTRNRCKRLLREAVRAHWSLLPDGIDFVLHARGGLVEARAEDVENEIVRMLPKAVRRLG